MSTYVGVGLGPIQTGIFMSGAYEGGFDRIVIAEVNNELKDAVNAAGGITINIAADDRVYRKDIGNVEVYNPMIPEERRKLVEAAAEASELATALPSVKFFGPTAEWMREGFSLQPERRRFVYTAENNNVAAECLEKAVDRAFPETYYLNTVIGKMSGVITEGPMPLLAPGAKAGHLVEEFKTIYISKCPHIEERRVASLFVKDDLFPFEEAKLYGHNAVHFLLGMLGKQAGCSTMDELRAHPDIIECGRRAFAESGKALSRKYGHLGDELFTEVGFEAYGKDLLRRMTNGFLKDAISRITRDIERKLGWEDRSVGAMRVILSQGVEPKEFAAGARLAALELASGGDVRAALAKIWPEPWGDEHERLAKLMGF